MSVEEGQTGASSENVNSGQCILVADCVAYFRIDNYRIKLVIGKKKDAQF